MINEFFNPVKELAKGLSIILKNGLKNRVTLKYPEEQEKVRNNFRGKIKYEKDKCIKCGNCIKVCPAAGCISINEYFSIDMSQCIFCGNCVEYCPVNALSHTVEYTLAQSKKDKLILKEEIYGND